MAKNYVSLIFFIYNFGNKSSLISSFHINHSNDVKYLNRYYYDLTDKKNTIYEYIGSEYTEQIWGTITSALPDQHREKVIERVQGDLQLLDRSDYPQEMFTPVNLRVNHSFTYNAKYYITPFAKVKLSEGTATSKEILRIKKFVLNKNKNKPPSFLSTSDTNKCRYSHKVVVWDPSKIEDLLADMDDTSNNTQTNFSNVRENLLRILSYDTISTLKPRMISLLDGRGMDLFLRRHQTYTCSSSVDMSLPDSKKWVPIDMKLLNSTEEDNLKKVALEWLGFFYFYGVPDNKGVLDFPYGFPRDIIKSVQIFQNGAERYSSGLCLWFYGFLLVTGVPFISKRLRGWTKQGISGTAYSMVIEDIDNISKDAFEQSKIKPENDAAFAGRFNNIKHAYKMASLSNDLFGILSNAYYTNVSDDIDFTKITLNLREKTKFNDFHILKDSSEETFSKNWVNNLSIDGLEDASIIQQLLNAFNLNIPNIDTYSNESGNKYIDDSNSLSPEYFHFVETLAANRTPEGLGILGDIYYRGDRELNIAQDVPRAINLWKQAAAAGNTSASLSLGQLSLNESSAGLEQAKQHFTEAANSSSPRVSSMAKYYLKRHGLDEKDKSSEFSYLKIAANEGDSYAQLLLGVAYLDPPEDIKVNTIDTQSNLKTALKYFRLAAKKNRTMAHYYIAILILRGITDNETDTTNKLSAVKDHLLKALRGHRRLGIMKKRMNFHYAKGDATGALLYALSLSEMGIPEAHVNAAKLWKKITYFDDILVKPTAKFSDYINKKIGTVAPASDYTTPTKLQILLDDPSTTYAYLAKTEWLRCWNYHPASYQGQPNNKNCYYHYLQRSVSENNVESTIELAMEFKSSSKLPEFFGKRAIHYLNKATKLGSNYAAFQLASCYYYGQGIERDRPAATKMALGWLKDYNSEVALKLSGILFISGSIISTSLVSIYYLLFTRVKILVGAEPTVDFRDDAEQANTEWIDIMRICNGFQRLNLMFGIISTWSLFLFALLIINLNAFLQKEDLI